jgi:hypothetical protein
VFEQLAYLATHLSPWQAIGLAGAMATMVVVLAARISRKRR